MFFETKVFETLIEITRHTPNTTSLGSVDSWYTWFIVFRREKKSITEERGSNAGNVLSKVAFK